MAICDALLDYYLPNQAQRQRAHRDLMARDGVAEGRGAALTMAPPTISPAGGRVAVSSSGRGVDGGAGGSCTSGGGDGNLAGQDGEERDVDDDVRSVNDFYSAIDCIC